MSVYTASPALPSSSTLGQIHNHNHTTHQHHSHNREHNHPHRNGSQGDQGEPTGERPTGGGPVSAHSYENHRAYAYDSLPAQQLHSLSPHLHHQSNDQAEQSALGLATSVSGGEGQKGNRLRKACDSCSIRKVKCDESGPPCRACASLDIPCTFERPSRRRGPPNRHAEAIKKRRLESPRGTATGSFSSPTSPSNVAATLASFSAHAVLNAESICPFQTLELLIDDFFTYIYPLSPFPHEPSFRAAFKHREDLNNQSFLALLASMVGVLVASFPRNPRLYLKAQHWEHHFPNSMSLVDRCHKVAVEARGAGYLDKVLTIYDAVTSYFLGLAAAYTFQWKQSRLYLGESLTMTKIIGAHRLRNTVFPSDPHSIAVHTASEGDYHDAQSVPIDFIRQEIARRLFWVMFVSIRSMEKYHAMFRELIIPPPTPTDPYPPLPLEVDDEYIYVDHVDPQPVSITSRLTGFNFLVKIYSTLTTLATMELAYGIDEIFDGNRQKRVLEECLRNIRQILDHAPPQLLFQSEPMTPLTTSPDYHQYFQSTSSYHGNAETLQQYQRGNLEAQRRLQFEIQKANIYASELSTRFYLVEKYWNLQEAYANPKASIPPSPQLKSPGVLASSLDSVLHTKGSTQDHNIGFNITSERENITKDFLRLLHTISPMNIEPNSSNFHRQIRHIASTLQAVPSAQQGPLLLKAHDYLERFLHVWDKLVLPTKHKQKDDDDDQHDDDELGDDDLRIWADLKSFQTAVTIGELRDPLFTRF